MNQRAVRTSENGVQLRPASLEEAGLFYSELDVEQDKALGSGLSGGVFRPDGQYGGGAV